MLVQIFDNQGELIKVSINSFVENLIPRFIKEAAEYGDEISIAEARQVLLDLASFRADNMPSYARIKCAEKGWEPFASKEANTTTAYAFKRGSTLRTVYADSFAEAVKEL